MYLQRRMGDDVPGIRISSQEAAKAFWFRPRRVERCEASCEASKTRREGPVTVRLINSTRWFLQKHRSQCLSSSHAQEVLVTPSLSSAESCDKLCIGESAISMCHGTGVTKIFLFGGGTSRPMPPTLHHSCTRLKLSRAAGDLEALWALQSHGWTPERNKNSKKIYISELTFVEEFL